MPGPEQVVQASGGATGASCRPEAKCEEADAENANPDGDVDVKPNLQELQRQQQDEDMHDAIPWEEEGGLQPALIADGEMQEPVDEETAQPCVACVV